MTYERMRVAIAESCGWKVGREFCDDGEFLRDPKRKLALSACYCPDYPNDLNACAEFADHLRKTDRLAYSQYCDELLKIVAIDNSRNENESRNLCDATARQRCEAFLRVKGL